MRCHSNWKSTRDTLKHLWDVYVGDSEPDDETSEESIYEYGLSFDYVAPGTFKDQAEAYWRYQLSWGGPSDEIRFFASQPDGPAYKIEYWLLDWFDGAHRILQGIDLDLLRDVAGWFFEGRDWRSEMMGD